MNDHEPKLTASMTSRTKLELLQNTLINLPADIGFGYSTERAELFKIVNRPLPIEETQMVMKALGLQMEMNRLRKLIIEDLEEVLEGTKKEFTDIANRIDDAIASIDRAFKR